MKNRAAITNSIREKSITGGIIVLFLGIWEWLARAGMISKLVFPPPSLIFNSLVVDLLSGSFNRDITITLYRLVAGLVLGGGLGLIFGLIMGWLDPIRRILDPIVSLLHPIPKLAILPMILIIFGLGDGSRIVMIALAAFFPMLVSTMFGVRQINPHYFDVIRSYGGTQLDIFKKVVIPGSLPSILSGFRLSYKMALTTAVGIEMVFGDSGLGSSLWLAWETMRLWRIYSIIFIISIFGAGTTWLVEKLNQVLMPWHQESTPE